MSSSRTVNSSPPSRASVNRCSARVTASVDRRLACSRRGDRDQQPIRRQQPQAVVDRLEPVQTEHEQRKQVTRPPRGPFDRAVQQVVEQQPVRQPGQRVGDLRLGDVGQRSGQPRRRLRLVADGRAAAEHPAERPVAMQDPVLALVVPASARQMRRHAFTDAGEVVVVHAREPLVGARADLRLLVAEHRLPPRRPVDLVRRQVPVPQAVVGAAHAPARTAPRFRAGSRPPACARGGCLMRASATGKSIGLVT